MSQLYDRLDDMEAAMRELAHAQATSSSVLSELGGRLSTGAGTNWPSQAGGSHGEEGLLALHGMGSCEPCVLHTRGCLDCWQASPVACSEAL